MLFSFYTIQLSPCHADKAVQREIFELEVYCKNKSCGCNWTGRVEDYVEVSLLCHNFYS
jgi:hypothetical protein